MTQFKFNPKQGVILCKAKLANKRQSAFIKLVVDTGASNLMISIETALAIGIDPAKSTRQVEITTASGIILVPIIKIPSFACFGIEIKNLDAACHNLPPQSPVDGLLGLNFLSSAKIIIDFSKNIIFAPNGAPPRLKPGVPLLAEYLSGQTHPRPKGRGFWPRKYK